MLLVTTMARANTTPKYAILSVRIATLNEAEFLSDVRMRVFCAETKIKPTATVTANFTNTKAGRSEVTSPESTGLSSRVWKNRTPITVVKQSMEPMKIKNKLLETVWLLCKTGFSPFQQRNSAAKLSSKALAKVNVAKISYSQLQAWNALAAFGILMMNAFLCVHCFE